MKSGYRVLIRLTSLEALIDGSHAAWEEMGDTEWNFRPSASNDFPCIWGVSSVGAPGLKTFGRNEARYSAEHRRAGGISSTAMRTGTASVSSEARDTRTTSAKRRG